MKVKSSEIRIKGAPVCRGIAIGKPYFFTFIDDKVPEFTIPVRDIDEEIRRYFSAVASSREDVKRLQSKLKKERIFEGAAILDTHLQIMQDPLLTTQVEQEIRRSRKNAEHVFKSIIKECQKKFQTMGDPFFRERFKDIQDISRRVMGYLRKSVSVSLADIPADSVVFSHELTASDAAEANSQYVNAIVTVTGGATSHASIVAKAKGIPYVTDVEFYKIVDLGDNSPVIVDGRNGEVIFYPKRETLQYYRQLQKGLNTYVEGLSDGRELIPETIDGYQIHLSANIDMVDDIDIFHNNGGHGVGLFRSEFIFISHNTFPTENEQYQIYKKLVTQMNGLPMVIRTFDFGGDKLKLNQHVPLEGNPFFGCSAIRYLLRERDIFKAQLRAILRAGALGTVSIMFPMISALSELLEAKEILFEAQAELEEKKLAVPESIRVGCMIEVPSATIIADLLAKECDFLSIGTNDLVQYSLAVDRCNYSASSIYASTDPSVIRMIKLVVSEANHHGIPVAVCGEMASDPRCTPLLLGLGVHELSVAPRYIPIVKRAIRNTSIVNASRLAEIVLSLTKAQDIYQLLSEEYQQSTPDDRFYNC